MQFGIRTLALTTAGLFAVAACGGSTTSGVTLAPLQELRVNIGTEPSSLDPGQTQWVYEGAVDRQLFEAPLKASKDFKSVVPNAADSWSVDSTGTVYTFKLHPGAKWSDGVPVKAADFVYAWQRLLDPRLAAPYGSFYTGIKNGAKVNGMDPKDTGIDAAIQTLGLKAVDDNTFQVTLETAAGYFKWIATLWTSAPVRKDVIQKFGKDSSGNDKWGAVAPSAVTTVVGNGQFKISEVVAKDHITLVQNNNYAGTSPKPTLTKVTLYEIDDDAVAYAKYKSGELDIAGVPLANTQAVRDDPVLSKELLQDPELTVFWVDINVKKAPFDKLQVRQAFAQAIDRESYVKNVLKARGYATTTFIPKGMRDFNPSLGTSQVFDPTKAKASLQASGLTSDQLSSMNIKYTYNSNSASSKQIAQFIAEQLKTNLGVTLILDGTDSKTNSKRLHTGNYQIGGPSGWGADYPDEQDWYDIFMTGSGNQFSNWANASYDKAVTDADTASDQAKRDTLYNQAGKILVDEAPVVFLNQRTRWTLIKSYVKGVTTVPNDDFPGDFYLYTVQIAQH
ncbi:MAG: ABC transporter substrate-binding protein [Candidatus Dormibacteraceae bacterium]